MPATDKKNEISLSIKFYELTRRFNNDENRGGVGNSLESCNTKVKEWEINDKENEIAEENIETRLPIS